MIKGDCLAIKTYLNVGYLTQWWRLAKARHGVVGLRRPTPWVQQPLHPLRSRVAPMEVRESRTRRDHVVHIFAYMFDKSNMRFHNPLDDILGNRIRVSLLRVLARAGSRGFTGRDLARMCGSSPSQATASLQVLEESGLIVRDIAGRSHVWRLAERHALAPVLKTLFRIEATSMSALQSDIESVIRKLPVQRAILFGSVARGDEHPTSDVDILLTVRSTADKEQVEETLSAASLHFAIRFGNPLSTLVMEERHFDSPPNPSLLANIRRDGVELETGE